MPAKKISPQAQRDRRAKIMLAVLGVVFVAVLGFELPSMMKGTSTPASAAPPAQTTTDASSGVAAPASAPAAAPALQVVAAAQPGQLTKFTRFAAKNPFKSLVATPASGGAAGDATATGGATSPPKPAPPASTTQPVPAVTFSATTAPATTEATGPMVLAAVINLNGMREVVPVNFPFPEKHPIFKLMAIGKKAMWISLVGGSFGAGQQTLKILRGHPIKLVNETASLDYVIRLVKLTMVPKPAPLPPTTSAPTTSSTTTAATTTSAG